MEAVATDMMAKLAESKVTLRTFHLPNDLTPRIREATSLNTEHTYCPFDTNKYNNHTETALLMDYA